MPSRRFKTKKQRKIVRSKRIVALVVSLVFSVVFILYSLWLLSFTTDIDQAVRESPEFRHIIVLISVAFVSFCILLTVPYLAIFFGIQSGRKKGHRANATYKASLGIKYYRDILKDMSPATMSLLMDLNIESRKDVSATLLRLYDKGMVKFEGGRVTYTGARHHVDRGEHELLNMIVNNDITRHRINHWKKNRKQDAITEGYISKSDISQEATAGCLAKGCLLGCLLPWVVLTVVLLGVGFYLGGYTESTSNNYTEEVTFLDTIDTSMFFEDFDAEEFFEAFERLEQNEIYPGDIQIITVGLERFIISFIILNITIFFLVFIFFRMAGHWFSSSQYKRTQRGNETAEKIAGLQRFIHEFSKLSEAKKEHVVLWNDFLVYAVVLEKNERIVNDISRYYKVNLRDVVNAIEQ